MVKAYLRYEEYTPMGSFCANNCRNFYSTQQQLLLLGSLERVAALNLATGQSTLLPHCG